MNQTPSISLPPGLHKDFLQVLVELEGMFVTQFIFSSTIWGGISKTRTHVKMAPHFFPIFPMITNGYHEKQNWSKYLLDKALSHWALPQSGP